MRAACARSQPRDAAKTMQTRPEHSDSRIPSRVCACKRCAVHAMAATACAGCLRSALSCGSSNNVPGALQPSCCLCSPDARSCAWKQWGKNMRAAWQTVAGSSAARWHRTSAHTVAHRMRPVTETHTRPHPKTTPRIRSCLALAGPPVAAFCRRDHCTMASGGTPAGKPAPPRYARTHSAPTQTTGTPRRHKEAAAGAHNHHHTYMLHRTRTQRRRGGASPQNTQHTHKQTENTHRRSRVGLFVIKSHRHTPQDALRHSHTTQLIHVSHVHPPATLAGHRHTRCNARRRCSGVLGAPHACTHTHAWCVALSPSKPHSLTPPRWRCCRE
jgi:hypothetical protein